MMASTLLMWSSFGPAGCELESHNVVDRGYHDGCYDLPIRT
jgi:hypothetical protein